MYSIRVSKEYKRQYKKLSEARKELVDGIVKKLADNEPLEANRYAG